MQIKISKTIKLFVSFGKPLRLWEEIAVATVQVLLFYMLLYRTL